MPKGLGDAKYRGKHLLLVEGKVVAAGEWKKVAKSLDRVYDSGKTPTLTYIPRADTLVLKLR